MRQVKGTVQPLFSNSSGVTSLNGASDLHPSRSTAIRLDLSSMLMLSKIMVSMDVRQFLKTIIYYQKTTDNQNY